MPWFKHASCLLLSNGNWWINPPYRLPFVLHLKRFLAGKSFDSNDELKESIEKRLMPVWRPTYMDTPYKTLCPILTSASVWVLLMSKFRLRYVEFDSNE
jgi:hypothetical protein